MIEVNYIRRTVEFFKKVSCELYILSLIVVYIYIYYSNENALLFDYVQESTCIP